MVALKQVRGNEALVMVTDVIHDASAKKVIGKRAKRWTKQSRYSKEWSSSHWLPIFSS